MTKGYRDLFYLTIIICSLTMVFPNFLGTGDPQAAPYLVCDPQATVTHYKVTGDAYWTANVPAQADGSIKSDLQGIATGNHNIQVKACKADAVWGELCSDTSPFSFTRPAGPSVPQDLGIAAQ